MWRNFFNLYYDILCTMFQNLTFTVLCVYCMFLPSISVSTADPYHKVVDLAHQFYCEIDLQHEFSSVWCDVIFSHIVISADCWRETLVEG